MTYYQAAQIRNNQLCIDAVLEYRRNPTGVTAKTFRRAEMWIEADHIIVNA